MTQPDFRAALKQLADAVDGWEMEPAEDDPLAVAMDHARKVLKAAEDGTHELGAAALAEATLAHPGFSGCHDGPAAPAAQGALDDRYEFSVVDSDDCKVAGGSAPTLDDAIREGRRELRLYNQHGPHKLEVHRVLVLDCSESANA